MREQATTPKPERFFDRQIQPIHGIIFALLCAFLGELLLRNAPLKLDYFARAGRMTITFIAIYCVHIFFVHNLRMKRFVLRDLVTVTLVVASSLVLIRLANILALGLFTYAEESVSFVISSVESLYYVFPFAAGALLLQAVLGFHQGLVYSVSMALLVGVYFPEHVFLLPFVLITSLVACLSLKRFRSRSDYAKAGLAIGLVGIPLAMASVLIEPSLHLGDIILRVAGAFVGGALCSFIAAGITPIVEHLGGYVTDMRLIEMATLDHPLLKNLSIQAPGTWNHSMVMGMMVEQAADAVDANPVLARVGAYFHDIGKTKKPIYFVENQGGEESRHQKLSTSMSALIIRSHVKDGIELARKHKLPEAIVDMIPQHHGTSLIAFFYNKAKEEAEEAGQDPAEVDKSLYSYPGPKPQTKEAGLLMLADGIEAAARTLKEPSVDRIQGMVQKMINKVFSSGQLNECELTLKDLHLIAKCYTRVLAGIYHQRIAYAEPAEKVSEKQAATDEAKDLKPGEVLPSSAASANGKKEATNHENGEAKMERGDSSEPSDPESADEDRQDASKEDLKRLGLSTSPGDD